MLASSSALQLIPRVSASMADPIIVSLISLPKSARRKMGRLLINFFFLTSVSTVWSSSCTIFFAFLSAMGCSMRFVYLILLQVPNYNLLHVQQQYHSFSSIYDSELEGYRSGELGSIIWITYFVYSLQNPSLNFRWLLDVRVIPAQKINKLHSNHQDTEELRQFSMRENEQQRESSTRKHRKLNLFTNQQKLPISLLNLASKISEQSLGSTSMISQRIGILSHFRTTIAMSMRGPNCISVRGSRQQTKKLALKRIRRGRQSFLKYRLNLT